MGSNNPSYTFHDEAHRSLKRQQLEGRAPRSIPDIYRTALSPTLSEYLASMPGDDGHGLFGIDLTRPQRRGDDLITGNEVVYGDSDKIVLPKGMSPDRAREIIDRVERDGETNTEFSRTYPNRSDDGAVAVARVLNRRYGVVFGEETKTSFGKMPAQTRDIEVEPGTSVQVPWGRLSIPAIEGATITVGDFRGNLHVSVLGPKGQKEEIEALFDDIAQQLKTSSIYRGKAMVGANAMKFIDLSGFDPEHIVLAPDVFNTLDAMVWTTLRYTEAIRAEGLGLRRAVLLYGGYGTGKTSVGMITALIAAHHGWTFLSGKSGDDDIETVMKTAELYSPAVVFIEDIDLQNSEIVRLLEVFDGITSKGAEVIMVVTTNHVGAIHQGLLRPGRFDAAIEFGDLDREGVERLAKVVVGTKLDPSVDFDAVFDEMPGFTPAFVKGVLTRARLFAITRQQGQLAYALTTADLVGAAQSLQGQLKLLQAANEGKEVPTVDAALGDLVEVKIKKVMGY
jgi:transitional endoplasmic reticulum ATPase